MISAVKEERMIRDINPDNQVAVLQLMRSVMVCFDILRTKGEPVAIDLLLDPSRAQSRREFIRTLDLPSALIFIKHYREFKKLTPQTKVMTQDLISAIYNCEEKFLLDLATLLEHDPVIIRFAFANLLQSIITHGNVTKYGGGYYGCGYYGSGYYGGIYYGGYYGGGYYSGGYYGCAYYGGGYNFADIIDELKLIKTDNYLDLQDEDLLELHQALSSPGGIKNAEGKAYGFKAGQRFTESQGKAIIFRMHGCSGDRQEQMFRAIAHEALSDPEILNKIRLIPGK